MNTDTIRCMVREGRTVADLVPELCDEIDRLRAAVSAVTALCDLAEATCHRTGDPADERCHREGCAYYIVDRDTVRAALGGAA